MRGIGVLVLLGACGGGGGQPDAASVDAMRECYASPPDGAPGECPTPGTPPGAAHVVFVNFAGATVFPGNDDASHDVSSLPNMVATIPPSTATAAEQSTLLNLIRETFAPYDVDVVTVRPSTGAYSMILVGGAPSDIG